MIVTCPSCSSRYQIKEERLSSKSGQVKCPKCSNLFRVLIEAEQEELQDNQTSGPEPVAQKATPLPPAITSALSAEKEEEEPAPPDPSIVDRSSRSPEEAPVKRNTSTKPAWKIKNTVGLIYDFQDLDSLVQWLSNRDNTDDLLTSPDGAEPWLPIKSVEVIKVALDAVNSAELTAIPKTQPEVVLSTVQQDAQRASEPVKSGDIPPPQPARDYPTAPRQSIGYNTGSIRPARQRAGMGTYIGIALTSVFLLLCLLQLTGWVDFQQILGLRGDIPLPSESTITSTSPPREVSRPNQPESETVDSPYDGRFPGQQRFEPLEETPLEDSAQLRRSGNNPNQLRIEAIKQQASQALNQGDTERAIQLISSATQLVPNDSELICLLADLHQRNNAYTEAELLRTRCEEIRSIENRE